MELTGLTEKDEAQKKTLKKKSRQRGKKKSTGLERKKNSGSAPFFSPSKSVIKKKDYHTLFFPIF
jgi:hypothetical protein